MNSDAANDPIIPLISPDGRVVDELPLSEARARFDAVAAEFALLAFSLERFTDKQVANFAKRVDGWNG